MLSELYPQIFKFTDTIENLFMLDRYWSRQNKEELIKLYLKRDYVGFTTKELFSIARINRINEINVIKKTHNADKIISMYRKIIVRPKTLFEQDIIKDRGFNLDEVIKVSGKFILLNDGSIYKDKTKISTKRYVVFDWQECDKYDDICVGLSVDNNVCVVIQNENKLNQIEDIIYVDFISFTHCLFSALVLRVIDKNNKLRQINLKRSFLKINS